MLKVAFLLALGTLCLAQSGKYTGSRTADMDFLHKQKKIYDLLLYVRQNDLIDAEWYDIGRNYNLESNMDMYKDKNAVQKFLWWYKQGMFLSRNAIFTAYNSEQLYEMRMLFDLFYYAKDFQTFYKTACWARLNMNDGMFTMALTSAVFFRNDCKYMRLPAIYEIYPNLFFDSNVIQQAQYIKMTRGSGSPANVGNVETYMINANYSSKYMTPHFDRESKMDYFREDVALNAYYYYFRMSFPFWMGSNKFSIPKEIRGELYYYMHQQLLAKYSLERMSCDLGRIDDFDWHKPIFPGFFSTLTFSNGIPVPQRNRYSSVPYYKFKYFKEIAALENRIMDAIDSGYMMDEQGKNIDIYSPHGLYMLANAIEGNVDSCNRRFYGMYDALARDILGFSLEQPNKDKVIPSALQYYSTSMRDPAFYMLYKRIMSFFIRYKKFQPQYSQNDLQMPGVKFESVNVDKLYTFFDNCDTLINNAVSVESFKNGMSLRVKARRSCLNYEPFTYKFNINSDKETKAVLTIFLGPAYEDVKDDMVYLQKYYYRFVEMDKFVVTLRPGSNTIERHSSESPYTAPDMMPADSFYDKLSKAISGGEPFMYSEKYFDFSERFTLPKGKRAGMPFKMFFFLNSLDESNMKTYDFPMFGKFMFGDKPLGFPLDRPMWAWNFTIPNMYFKDVHIYNREEPKRMNY